MRTTPFIAALWLLALLAPAAAQTLFPPPGCSLTGCTYTGTVHHPNGLVSALSITGATATTGFYFGTSAVNTGIGGNLAFSIGASISSAQAKDAFSSLSTQRVDTSPLAEVVGEILEDGPNASSTNTHFLEFRTTSTTITAGAEFGKLGIFTMGGGGTAGTLADMIDFAGAATPLITVQKGVQFQLQGATSGTSTLLAPATGGGNVTFFAGADTVAGKTVANGGTNCSAASITCFNNITGFTASGTTGTTSTNLVFSASPTLTGTLTSATITASGLITGTLGETLTGAVTSINASSNFGVNICTGTCNGTVTVGNSASTFALGTDLKSTSTAISTPTSCGTSPTAAAGSTDTAGEITEGTTAAGCVIAFTATKTNAPFCVVTTQSQLVSFAYVISTTAITVTNTSASGDKIDYHCVQH